MRTVFLAEFAAFWIGMTICYVFARALARERRTEYGLLMLLGLALASVIGFAAAGIPILWIQWPLHTWLLCLLVGSAAWQSFGGAGLNAARPYLICAVPVGLWTLLDSGATSEVRPGVIGLEPIALQLAIACVAIVSGMTAIGFAPKVRRALQWLGKALVVGLLALPFLLLVAMGVREGSGALSMGNFRSMIGALPRETSGGWTALYASVSLATLNVAGTIASSSLAAYAFARLRFAGRDVLFAVLVGSMALPSAATLVPHFEIVRRLGLYDSWLPLFVPSFLGSALAIFLLRQFMLTVPEEAELAASIEGASHRIRLWNVLMPQIMPAVAAVGFGAFLASWNNLLGPLTYLSSPEKMPVPYVLQLFGTDHGDQPGIVAAAALASLLPVLAVFVLVQKWLLRAANGDG